MIRQALALIHRRVYGPLLYDRRIQILEDEIAALLPESGSVLDVGMGSGRLAGGIQRRKPGLSLRGIDVHVHPDCPFDVAVYDGRTLPLPDDSVDWVMVVDVLHHAEDPPGLLRECARVAKHGVVLKDHPADTRWSTAALTALDWAGNAVYGVPVPFNFLSTDEWRQAFAEAELEVTAFRSPLPIYPTPLRQAVGNVHFIAALHHRADQK